MPEASGVSKHFGISSLVHISDGHSAWPNKMMASRPVNGFLVWSDKIWMKRPLEVDLTTFSHGWALSCLSVLYLPACSGQAILDDHLLASNYSNYSLKERWLIFASKEGPFDSMSERRKKLTYKAVGILESSRVKSTWRRLTSRAELSQVESNRSRHGVIDM